MYNSKGTAEIKTWSAFRGLNSISEESQLMTVNLTSWDEFVEPAIVEIKKRIMDRRFPYCAGSNSDQSSNHDNYLHLLRQAFVEGFNS